MSEIHKIHLQLMNKEITCTDLVQEKLTLLKENTHNTVNAFLDTLALELAAKVDAKIAKGEEIGLLEGIPFGIKDVYMVQGTYTTASSNLLKKYKSPYTATAIQKLLDAGAIPLVKENCDSFGHGSSSENTIFGAVKNAVNSDLVGGGSSGGSAVNVAKDFTVFSIGGDTGGSISQKAGYNKVLGFKPTYGRISRHGLLAYASSFDQIGIFAPETQDVAIVLEVIAGSDDYDSTASEKKVVSYNEASEDALVKKKIAYLDCYVDHEGIDEEVRVKTLSVIEQLKKEGHQVDKISFEFLDEMVPTYYVLTTAEASSNLARFDGIHYGYRSPNATDLESTYKLS